MVGAFLYCQLLLKFKSSLGNFSNLCLKVKL